MLFPTTIPATSPAAAVTSPRITIKYKKNRILCGLRLVFGLFLRVLLVIFENRKTPRFDACQKIAVRSWLNRNGVLNLELFYFAPDKTSRWQIVGPPRIIARRFAFYNSFIGMFPYKLKDRIVILLLVIFEAWKAKNPNELE